jgi:hypothetical protein
MASKLLVVVEPGNWICYIGVEEPQFDALLSLFLASLLSPYHSMLTKLTAKNQITLPKKVTQALSPFEYLEVETRNGQIVLTPVRLQRAESLRAKLAELEITERDVSQAVAWARSGGGA